MVEKLCIEFDNEIFSVWKKILFFGKKFYFRVLINVMIVFFLIIFVY